MDFSDAIGQTLSFVLSFWGSTFKKKARKKEGDFSQEVLKNEFKKR